MTVAGDGVVVTGAGHGIGRALATRLAAEGARVVVNDIDAAAAQQVATTIGGYAVVGDAASAEGVAALVDAARDRLGGIDMYLANAGVVRGMGIDAADDEWASSWEINTMAHVRAARLLLSDWLDRGRGRFVVTASAAGLQTTHGLPTYAVTKHAAVAFAEWLSLTYRHRGLTVQAICPQGVSTALLQQTGAVQSISTADGALTPEQVADAFWEGLQDGRFLILPHPETAKYYRRRAEDPDRWLALMNRLQQSLEAGEGRS